MYKVSFFLLCLASLCSCVPTTDFFIRNKLTQPVQVKAKIQPELALRPELVLDTPDRLRVKPKVRHYAMIWPNKFEEFTLLSPLGEDSILIEIPPRSTLHLGDAKLRGKKPYPAYFSHLRLENQKKVVQLDFSANQSPWKKRGFGWIKLRYEAAFYDIQPKLRRHLFKKNERDL